MMKSTGWMKRSTMWRKFKRGLRMKSLMMTDSRRDLIMSTQTTKSVMRREKWKWTRMGSSRPRRWTTL